jgi:hypothetical protein
MDAPIEGLTLNCAIDGESLWEGDVFCKECKAIYLAVTVTADESGKKRYVYAEAPPKGMCTCEKRLFGGTEFTARPMCHGCAIRVTTRKAFEKMFKNISADEAVKKIVAWLRTPVPGTMCDDQHRDNAIADAIERGDWMEKS